VELPQSVRDNMIEELDEYLDAIATPDPEALTAFVVELLEAAGEELVIDDIIGQLEEDGALEDSFSATVEEEMRSNDAFLYTGEEIASLLERLCDIEWSEGVDDDDFDDEFDDDDDDDFDDL